MIHFVLRRAQAHDLPCLKALQAAAMKGAATSHYSETQIDAHLEVAGPEMDQVLQAGAYWLACRGEIPIACAGWHPTGGLDVLGVQEAADPSVASIRSVFTHPLWMGRGLAGALMDKVEAEAAAAGAARTALYATLGAVSFYLKRGYHLGDQVLFDLKGVPFLAVQMGRTLRSAAHQAA